MKQQVDSVIENRPGIFGFAMLAVQGVVQWFVWCVAHIDEFSKVFALIAAVFAAGGSWYAMRMKRRQFFRMSARQRPKP